MHIRLVTPEDTPARVTLHRACVSYSVATEELIDSMPDDPAACTLRLAAEIDGQLVATAMAELNLYAADGAATVNFMVSPEHRGKGVGAALYRRIDTHLAQIKARRVTTHAFDDLSVGFGERRGFTSGRATRVSEADPRLVRPLPIPAGITLRAASELPDLRAAYEVALASAPDIPSDTPYVALSYDQWLAARSRNASLDLDSSFLAFAGDKPVALTLTEIVEDCMISLITGTCRGYRRRGLASIAKAAALSTAAVKGVTRAYTFNDSKNTPMLAVNNQFGYQSNVVVRELIQERTCERGQYGDELAGPRLP